MSKRNIEYNADLTGAEGVRVYGTVMQQEGGEMSTPRTDALKKLDAALRANAALYLLDTLAEMLGQVPHVDVRLSRNIVRWHNQLIAERNRMLPLSDKADRLVHNG